MKQPRVIRKTHVQTSPNGFSEWVQPRMSGYFMACCDCSLVHEMQFRVAAGKVRGINDGQSVHVQFRARRAVGITKRERARK